MRRSNSNCSRGLSSALIRWFSTSAGAVVEQPRSDKPLYRRLSALGTKNNEHKGAVIKTMNEYLREGKVARKYELDRCVTELRRYGRFQHALEILEWMETRGINYRYRDYAIRLDLISKVQGIAAAEKYFKELSPGTKNLGTYGALLNCYCVEKMEDKALTLFEEMKGLNFATTTIAFNNIMALYMRLGQPEKVPPLVEEMKSRDIRLDTFTYNILMHSYSQPNDIEGAERVFEEMTRNNTKERDWTTYSNLAIIYINAGLREKAETALKKLEAEMGSRNRDAYHFLISLHSKLSNLSEVHRVWELLKSTFERHTNTSYLTMFQALNKLNDLDGLRERFGEWESSCSNHDMRLVNCVVGAYLRHNLVDDAVTIFKRAIERSSGPFFIAWEMFMMHYLKNHQKKQAFDCLDAIKSQMQMHEWRPRSEFVHGLLKYFKDEEDVDGAEYFCKMTENVFRLDQVAYRLLLETYEHAGRTAPKDMKLRMQKDGIEMNSEIEKLLTSVCPD